jgi:asparagine synthase (glutamine-hydrolysing)
VCGICGIIGRETASAEKRVRNMMDAMIHRGPDGDGILIRPGAILGVRRLSIIDPRAGHQPIFNETGDVGVVFNGEIYNFRHLRRELEMCGHRFTTCCDTEVIVHAYEEWGERCVEHLHGMFAFALWDGRNICELPAKLGRVFLARDRLGIKPLYYSVADGALLFASEVRALLATGAIERRLSLQGIEGYLLFGSVVEPTTLIEAVYSLQPGHSLTLELGNSIRLESRHYCDVSASADVAPESARTPDLAVSQLRALMQAAVSDHLFADVPAGVFLSGGLDSSCVAALAAREHGNIQTFTLSFREREFDEGALARSTAGHLRTRHHELLLSEAEMQSRLFEAVGAFDQPSMDGVNTYFISLGAREAGLNVALSGLGGDELFAGYPVFWTTPALGAILALARRLPRQLGGKIARVLIELGEHSGNPARADRLRKLSAIFNRRAELPHAYFFARMLFTPEQVDALLLRSTITTDGNAGHTGEPSWIEAMEQLAERAELFEGQSVVRYLELRHYMLNTLLRDTDAMSMHHSLELRVPLLDDRIVAFVESLPNSLRLPVRAPKAFLSEAVKDLLPAEILKRPKRPFTFPWERWLRGNLTGEIGRRLRTLTPSLASALNAQMVDSIWTDFLSNRTGWARPWSLFVLNEWVRIYIDNAESQIEPRSNSVKQVAAT